MIGMEKNATFENGLEEALLTDSEIHCIYEPFYITYKHITVRVRHSHPEGGFFRRLKKRFDWIMAFKSLLLTMYVVWVFFISIITTKTISIFYIYLIWIK